LALAVAGVLGASGVAKAQDLEFKGTTSGCFIPDGGVVCSPSYQGLSYTGGSFDVFSLFGKASIGSLANNLGWFDLNPPGGITQYNGSFLLSIMFTKPTVTGDEIFTAMVTGAVTTSAGFLSIVFDPSSKVFDYTSGGESGSFLLSVNNLNVDPGYGPVMLTGSVSSITATPEPGTTALLATGLLGLIPVVRARRRKTSALAV
jgi:hypothetical protein